ncbi:ParB/RepB/Spo0J family partition protein [Thaumasiovibrio subtropicus]|uniref:ParB/RepB/Spo0J family partition protein n=1 Tax=Thaumasiovibrio subtropicus TaxID=1891207 RepID=UPI000B35BDD5|nr:ParB/RepB/Spo0J family partition protein [Thaumasiovibrio subtropicus]
MAIKTSDLNARLFGKANKRRATSPQEAQTAAKEKAAVIELAVAGEATVSFELVTVAADEVASKTRVFEENAREQAFLTEHALADILITLQERGQQFPAVGRWCEDGTIEVLDGSRRRMACIHSSKPFLVYVAHGITTKHAKFLSDVANAHKPLSLYERGKEMQAMLSRGDVTDQKELAKVCQCSEALVSGALKAADLPMELLMAYPSVSELGRPTIVKLHRLFFNLPQSQQTALISALNQDDKPLWQTKAIQGLSRLTREVTLDIENRVASSVETKPAKASAQELVKGKVSYQRNKDKLTMKFNQLDDDKMAALLKLVQDFIEK